MQEDEGGRKEEKSREEMLCVLCCPVLSPSVLGSLWGKLRYAATENLYHWAGTTAALLLLPSTDNTC